jgi:amylosucrase
VVGRLWAGLRRLVTVRRATRAVHVQGRAEPLWTGNDHVFGVRREHAGSRLLVQASFSADAQRVARPGSPALTPAAAEPDGRPLVADGDEIVLAPYQHLWLA